MEDEKNNVMRHSCAHLLAAAVLKLYPHTKIAIGPTIEYGFYYDFLFDPIDFQDGRSMNEKEFSRIEQTMREIKNKKSPITHKTISIDEAKTLFSQQPYKLELINEIAEGKRSKDGKIDKTSLYTLETFTDLCKGPHVRSADQIGHFKLLSVAGAYWKGSEKNTMLTRIYGTCFTTKEELDKYLCQLEEAKKRDHRKLGAELDLFVFSELVGKGLPLLTPKGTIIRQQLEQFIKNEEVKRGYQYVLTPPLARTELYKTSGHYPYYKNTMYPPMIIDDEELILRPMTCPHHFMLYKSRPKSYRDLPLRYAELAPQFRYEKSGELTGLMRVRTFCLSDAHIFCTPSQAREEIIGVIDLIDYVNKTLGMIKGKDYRYRLSLGDRSDNTKFYNDDPLWEQAEKILRTVLIKLKAPYYEAKGEAAFYGPKIDVQVKKINGHEETAFTVQYDFVMPKRFNLVYVDSDGTEKQPIVIHRSSIGAFERTMAFLIEHFAGAFPLWLSPIQVIILPISDKHFIHSQKVYDLFKKHNIRVEIDRNNKTIGHKIRQATLQKIPYMVIIGDTEEKKSGKGTLFGSVRSRDRKNEGLTDINLFIELLKTTIEKLF